MSYLNNRPVERESQVQEAAYGENGPKVALRLGTINAPRRQGAAIRPAIGYLDLSRIVLDNILDTYLNDYQT